MSSIIKQKKKSHKGYKSNAIQSHLLDLFSFPLSKNELTELRDVSVNYYNQKVTEEASLIWKQKKLSNRKLNNLLKTS